MPGGLQKITCKTEGNEDFKWFVLCTRLLRGLWTQKDAQKQLSWQNMQMKTAAFNKYFRVEKQSRYDLTLTSWLTLLRSPAFPSREKTKRSVSHNVCVLITPALHAKGCVFLKTLQHYSLHEFWMPVVCIVQGLPKHSHISFLVTFVNFYTIKHWGHRPIVRFTSTTATFHKSYSHSSTIIFHLSLYF